jgi:autotransporter-associated beta strand protein
MLLAFCLAFLLAAEMRAATITWVGGTGTGTSRYMWRRTGGTAGGNWNPTNVPTAADAVHFNTSNTYIAITLAQAENAGTLTFDSAAGAFTFSDGTATGSLTIAGITGVGITNNSASTQTFNIGLTISSSQTWNAAAGALTFTNARTVALGANTLTLEGSYDITISDAISGTGGSLTKTGSGTLTLSGANSYTGATTVNAGVLNIQNATATGTTAGGVSVASGAALQMQGGIAVGAEALALGGTGISNDGALRNISGNNTWGGAITISGTNTRIDSDAGTLTLSGAIGGNAQNLIIGGASGVNISNVIGTTTGTLAKDGAGTLTLSGANTFSGGTTIGSANGASGGTIQLGANNTLPGDVTVYAGTLSTGTYSDTIGALSLGGGASGTTAAVSTTTGILTLGGNVAYNATNNPNGATISGLLALGTTDRTFTVNDSSAAASDLTVSAVISGSHNITKTGSGTLVLSGANSYTGTTAIDQGVVNIQNATALGSNAGDIVTVASGAALQIQNSLTLSGSKAITLNGTGVSNDGALRSISGTNTVGGAITLGSDSRINSDAGTLTLSGGINGAHNLTVGGAGATSIGGAIGTGSGSLTKDGAGTLTLSAGNSYTGATTISTGVVNISNSNALGTTDNGTSVASGAALQVQGGIAVGNEALTLNGTGISAGGALRSISGTNSWAGPITLGSDSRINSDAGTLTLSIGGITGAYNLTVGGAGNTTISDVIGTGSGSLTKDGAGTLTLSVGNSYTGGTTLGAGTLTANDNGALGTGTLTMSGGTLNSTVAGTTVNNPITLTASSTLSNIATGGLLTNYGTYTLTMSGATQSGGINLSNNTTGRTLTVNVASGTSTISGAIANGSTSTSNLTKTGAGALVLSGSDANTYTGTTTLSAGTLTADKNNALGTGTLILDGGTLNSDNGSTVGNAITLTASSTVNDITTSGLLSNRGYTLTTSGATLSGGVNINSRGSAHNLTVNVGSGTSTISGVVERTGGGTSALIKTGSGTLVLSNANTYTDATTISAGVINIQNGAAFGTTAGGVTVANNAALQMQGGIAVGAEALTLSGTGISTDGALRNMSGGNSWAGAITLGANTQVNSDAGTLTLSGAISGNYNLTVGGAGDTTISGVIGTGAHTLTKTGSGTLVLSGAGANTYTGATTIGAGVVNIQKGAAFGTTAGGVTVASGAALQTQGGITVGAEALALSGTGISNDGALRNISGNNTWGGAITLSGANTRINSDAGALTLSGAIGGSGQNLVVGGAGNTTISNAIGTGSGTLTKDGAGALVLSGANSYSGGTTIGSATAVGGTLQLGTGGTLPTGGEVTVYSGTLDLNSHSASIGALNLGGNSIGAAVVHSGSGLTLGGDVTFNAANNPGGATIDGNGLLLGSADRIFNINYSSAAAPELNVIAPISGTHGITKTGSGTLQLSGDNTNYTGTTTVNGGYLDLDNLHALAGPLVVNSGGAVRILSDLDPIDLTLNNGSYDLGGHSSTLGSILIEGTSSILFTGTSTLTAASLTLDPGAILNILNWGSGDVFNLTSFTGDLNDIYFDGIKGGKWSGGELTPVPEPSFYAALMALGLFGGLLWFRARRAPQAC